jgi:ketosteroid isomerase-like protein
MFSESTRKLLDDLFEKIGQGAAPEVIAAFFSEEIDWLVLGPADRIPWIGRRNGRLSVADFYRDLRKYVVPTRYQVRSIVVEGENAFVSGELGIHIKETGNQVETEFVIELKVRDGLVSYYRFFEDSFAVAKAASRDL